MCLDNGTLGLAYDDAPHKLGVRGDVEALQPHFLAKGIAVAGILLADFEQHDIGITAIGKAARGVEQVRQVSAAFFPEGLEHKEFKNSLKELVATRPGRPTMSIN